MDAFIEILHSLKPILGKGLSSPDYLKDMIGRLCTVSEEYWIDTKTSDDYQKSLKSTLQKYYSKGLSKKLAERIYHGLNKEQFISTLDIPEDYEVDDTETLKTSLAEFTQTFTNSPVTSANVGSIETCINKELEHRGDRVTKNKYMPPHLEIPSFKKYKFETINNKGTNANNRSLVLLDLSILNNTCLPAVAHDSILFDSISRTDLSQLLKEYNSFNDKQIFIALDKTDHCTDEARAIIANKTELKLDDGKHALFGLKWGEKPQA